jgi:hypothetical protein
VVGVQPFGGEGLSGTGPKAGGPHYLPRFATERTLTINTTAAGGNASLLTLEIKLINRHTQAERSILDRQHWRFDAARQRWWLTSGLPDITESR